VVCENQIGGTPRKCASHIQEAPAKRSTLRSTSCVPVLGQQAADLCKHRLFQRATGETARRPRTFEQLQRQVFEGDGVSLSTSDQGRVQQLLSSLANRWRGSRIGTLHGGDDRGLRLCDVDQEIGELLLVLSSRAWEDCCTAALCTTKFACQPAFEDDVLRTTSQRPALPQVTNVRPLRPALQAAVVLLFAPVRSMQIELNQPSVERGARDAQQRSSARDIPGGASKRFADR